MFSAYQSVLLLSFGYLIAVRVFRHRREASLREEFGYSDRSSLKRMTTAEAQKIIYTIASYEFPSMLALGMEFGIFKVLIPKRLEDTAVLVMEFLMNPPTCDRTAMAISRVNYLHSRYRKSGKITNEDMLYTLSVFITEPVYFIQRYEWRTLNDMEYCAFGVLWKAIGDAMGIEYAGRLKGAKNGWQDGVDFAEDISAWAQVYEIEHMIPDDECFKLANTTISTMTRLVPECLKPVVAECISSQLDERVRNACKLPEPREALRALLTRILTLRRFLIRHVMLPRLWPVRYLASEPDPVTGRFNLRFTQGSHPFYVKPTIWKRWGTAAWTVWLLGGALPGDDYTVPEGYLFEEIGPRGFKQLDREELASTADSMLRGCHGGCPVAR